MAPTLRKRAAPGGSGQAAKRHNTGPSAPPARPKPPAFANTRQALVESLPWYKQMQASIHTTNKTAYGVYLGVPKIVRGAFAPDVIITTVGGSLEQVGNATSEWVRAKEMTARSKVLLESVRTSMEKGVAVGVIANKDYPFLPVKPEHPFNVLGFYLVTDMWAECAPLAPEGSEDERSTPSEGADVEVRAPAQRGATAYLYRLERFGQVENKWWVDGSEKETMNGQVAAEDSFGSVELTECGQCHRASPRIYENGWTCVNEACDEFFVMETETELVFTRAFMKPGRTTTPFITHPLTPAPPTKVDHKIGFICPDCNMCNRRLHWSKFVCEDPNCGFSSQLSLPKYTAEHIDKDNERRDRVLSKTDGIWMHGYMRPAVGVAGDFRTFMIPLPDEDGKIIGGAMIFRPNRRAFATGMVQQIETADFGFKRNPARNSNSQYETLTNHFAKNWGANYKFAVSVNSMGFDEAPDVVLQAVQQLTWAGEKAVAGISAYIRTLNEDREQQDLAQSEESEVEEEDQGEEGKDEGENGTTESTDDGDPLFAPFQPFNECLSLAYFEDSKISFHDDGEHELGPTVATLSVGGPSVMEFRPKHKYAFEGLPKAGGNYKSTVKFELFSGDMVVMHGNIIHRLYEHQVTPSGYRRYAMTCRSIMVEKIADEKERAAAIEKGKMPKRAKEYAFDGTLN